jgi:hypothetical protein
VESLGKIPLKALQKFISETEKGMREKFGKEGEMGMVFTPMPTGISSMGNGRMI